MRIEIHDVCCADGCVDRPQTEALSRRIDDRNNPVGGPSIEPEMPPVRRTVKIAKQWAGGRFLFAARFRSGNDRRQGIDPGHVQRPGAAAGRIGKIPSSNWEPAPPARGPSIASLTGIAIDQREDLDMVGGGLQQGDGRISERPSARFSGIDE